MCVCEYFSHVGGMAQDKPSPMLFLTACLHGNRHICQGRGGGGISCCACVVEDSYHWSLCVCVCPFLCEFAGTCTSVCVCVCVSFYVSLQVHAHLCV